MESVLPLQTLTEIHRNPIEKMPSEVIFCFIGSFSLQTMFNGNPSRTFSRQMFEATIPKL